MNLPSALSAFDALDAQGRSPLIFLDYDGTLTPIVSRPELATLGEDTRGVLDRLSRLCVVGILSGRDLRDVRALVGLDGLHYGGCHGLEILMPGDAEPHKAVADDFVERVRALAKTLETTLADIDGTQIEVKRYSLAVHYRRVDRAQVPEVLRRVAEARAAAEGFREVPGKEVVEIVPDVDWNKGVALNWIIEQLADDRAGVLPIYVGDDRTDEDAFKAIREDGVGVLVSDQDRPSAARYALRDTGEVRAFLDGLAARLQA